MKAEHIISTHISLVKVNHMTKLDISNAQMYKSFSREKQQIFWMKIQFTLKEVEWKEKFLLYTEYNTAS